MRLPVVGVMGSGLEDHPAPAEAVGQWLAGEGVHLLTGGGAGVMARVSQAFHDIADRRGLVVGVLPSTAEDPRCPSPPGYPNRWVELPVRTHLPLAGARGTEPLSRNHVNVLTADVVIALPGSEGTASEVALALRYGRPVVAFLDHRDQIPGLPPEVPVERELSHVKTFVRRALEKIRARLETC